MKRFFRYLALTLGALVALALVVYATLVHPNDSRVAPIAQPAAPLAAFTERKASLLLDQLPHELDLDADEYAEARQALAAAIPSSAFVSSARFKSPYQLYLPVGRYPLRLDARDGLYIPNGRTLTVQPHLSGPHELRFGLYVPNGAATLTVAKASGPLREIAFTPRPGGPDTDSKWYRQAGRYLNVDPLADLAAWQDETLPADLADSDELRFTCTGAPLGCVVSDVAFYALAPAPPENVLVILVDTLRAEGLQGGHAPRLSALASDSTVFANALAAGNMTSPSTNAFLSCRQPSQLGQLAFAYTVSPEKREAYYGKGTPSFPARFEHAGYDTAMIGNVSVISEVYGVGVNHGFARQVSLETDGYDTPAIAREAVRWLEKNGDHRFFLYVHFNGPHAPYRAPLKDVVGTFPGSKAFRSYADTLLWLYQSEISYTDRYVGQVLDALKALGLDRRTRIVVTADHGDQHHFHHFARNHAAPDFDGAYFDHGATLLNDEIHVPLVVHQPGAAPKRITDYVSTLDVGPTLLELASLKGGDTCAGTSLAPYLRGGDTAALKARVLGSEGFQGRALVFDGRYKYIRSYDPTDKKVYAAGEYAGVRRLLFVPEQLYDLAQDPEETHDLADEAPELLARARAIYRGHYAIKDAFELVIENPYASPVEADLPPGTDARIIEGGGTLTPEDDGVVFQSEGHKRIVLALDRWTGPGLPEVAIDGEPLAVTQTSLRLPVAAPAGSLPPEISGAGTLLDPPRDPAAYLRHVEDDGQSDHQLLTGNPAFEKVLREWGYLNDK